MRVNVFDTTGEENSLLPSAWSIRDEQRDLCFDWAEGTDAAGARRRTSPARAASKR